MILKRIEIEGFKSFADRTVIPFESGLTGIVGPNGCGKSNIVDALMWVMAERSAKALRADSMGDVIFEGSDGRPPAPYAMAEIILEDENRLLEGGGELAVGRRLFRSGESEYLLNGRRVKRKAVWDALLQAGLGVRGYMVLAQGKIDAVLAANPKDRRSVLEEAAGISRYKARKHEALLKLSSVGQNLERIDDVLGEVQRTVRSLRYQAGKARRFAEMRDRYRELRIRVALADESRLRAEERGLRESGTRVEQELADLKAERDAAEARLQALEKEAEALRAAHEVLRGRASSAKEQVAGLEERVRGLEARAAETEHRLRREEERLKDLFRIDQERTAASEGLRDECKALETECREACEARAAAEKAHQEALCAHRERREAVETLRKGVLEALAERTRAHNRLGEIASRRGEIEGALRSLRRRQGETEEALTKLGGECAEARKALDAAERRLAAAEGENAGLVAERDELRGQRGKHLESAQAARSRAADARARLEALEAVDEGGQGLPPQVREVLRDRPAGVAGLLLEGVRVPAPWDRLVENLLGRMQHALWTEGRGRAAGLDGAEFDLFFPPEKPHAPVNLPPVPPLRSLLAGEGARCDALCARLGEVYCAESGAEAARLAVAHPGALFLSRDGELHAQGFARVGMLAGEATGLLARRNAKELARQTIQTAEEQEGGERKQEEVCRGRLEVLDKRLSALATDLREALAGRDRARGRCEEARRRVALLEEERKALDAEVAQQARLLEAALAEELAASAERDGAESRRAGQAAELEEAEAGAAALETAYEAAGAALQEARLHEERTAERANRVEQRLAELAAQAAGAAKEQRRLEEEMAEIRTRAAGLRQEADAGREQSRGLLAERAALDERLKASDAQCARAHDALAAERERRETDGGRVEAVLEERQALALDLQRVHLQREDLSRGVSAEFHQPLDDLARAQGLDPAAFRMEPEEHASRSRELADLRVKLDEVGAVNLEAVRELEEREQRASFLERERRDLVAARARLEETLEELDTLCRDRFAATFAAVSEQFESIFRRLFRGGRAEVSLTPGEDPLTAGIEITVRPPGKELRSINLLSGGERTLTALALLLAVFRSRPSPFCLLDEVDAALDDANVERFLDILGDFTEDTQFIVVTHNRLTMAHCARLFGVTMRKPGVSLVVAVELADVVAAGGGEPGTGRGRGLPAASRGARLAEEKEAAAGG